MDLTELTLEYDVKKFYMFLSLNYAIIADTDINSEWMRSIGTLRYTLRGIRNVIAVKHYDGNLSFNGVRINNVWQEVDANNLTQTNGGNQSFKHFVAFNAPFIGQG